MAKIEVKEATPDDAFDLAMGLRLSDAVELWALGIFGVIETRKAIEQSIAGSKLCWSFFVDGKLACIAGVAPLAEGVGSPWMLSTAALDHCKGILVRVAPSYIAQMEQLFPVLQNHVHAKNSKSVRWLLRLGFELHPAEPYGPLGKPFHFFEMRG